MKKNNIILLLLVCCMSNLAAGPLGIKIVTELQGVDAKWWAPNEKGVIPVPSIITRLSEESKIEILKMYTTEPTAGKIIETPCGLTIRYTPEIGADGIAINGSMMLKRALDANAAGIATRFESSETLIGCVFKNGESKKIELAAGGSAVVTVTLIGVDGKPVKLNIEQVGADQPATAPESKPEGNVNPQPGSKVRPQ